MQSVSETLFGVTLVDDGAGVLLERQWAEHTTARKPSEDDAAEKLLRDEQAEDSPFAPEVTSFAEAIFARVDEDRLAVDRLPLACNG